MVRRESCIEPVGASSIQASFGAPGSRPQFREEILGTTAGRQEPLRREQERGPQHKVKPAASTELQSRSRSAHVTGEAMSAARVSETGGAAGPGGVWGAARVQGSIRDAGDPSRQPESGQGRAYKPMAKASGVQRESEGFVATNEGGNKPLEGRDPVSVVVGLRGKREGMVVYGPPNFPEYKSARTQQQPMGASQMARSAQVVTPRLTFRGDASERTPGIQGRKSTMHAASGRPSVSRVREIRMHGLTGGLRKLDLETGTGA